MIYYLQDSGSVFWQLGITTDGQWNPQPVGGTPAVNTILLQDPSGQWYQLTISTSGQPLLNTTSTPTSTQPQYILTSNFDYLMGVSLLGQLTLNPLVDLGIAVSQGEADFGWGGTDGMG